MRRGRGRQLDEATLLEFIEGAMSPADEARLRARLAGNLDLLDWLERVRGDRALLRSAEQPAAPADLLRQIEPLLARPMLMEVPSAAGRATVVRPGEFRRRHRRERALRRATRLGAAACVVLVAGAALWYGVDRMTSLIDGARSKQAVPGAPLNAPATPFVVADGDPTPGPGEGTVHHYGPRPIPLASDPPAPRPEESTEPGIRSAEFMLVVRGRAGAVEAGLTAAVDEFEAPSALVRNFSYDEAEQIEHAMLARDATERPPAREPLRADTSRERSRADFTRIRELADRVRVHLDSGEAPREGSGRLAGAPALVPSYEQQLTFSSRGAGYTISIRAGELARLLRRLHEDDRLLVSMTAWPEASPAPAGVVAERLLRTWATQRDLRDVVAQTVADDEHAVVLVPVSVIVE